MLVRVRSKGNIYPSMVGVQTCTASVEISIVVLEESVPQGVPQDPVILHLDIYQRLLRLTTEELTHPCSLLGRNLFLIGRNWIQPRWMA